MRWVKANVVVYNETKGKAKHKENIYDIKKISHNKICRPFAHCLLRLLYQDDHACNMLVYYIICLSDLSTDHLICRANFFHILLL